MTDWRWTAGGRVLRFYEVSAHGESVEISEIGGDGTPVLTMERRPVFAGGARVVGQWVPERYLMVTLNIEAPPSRFVAYWREIIDKITCTRLSGEGKFRVTQDDGTWRELSCLYSAGLDEGFGDGALIGLARPVVEFLAPDPYWYGPRVESISFGYGTTLDFLDPFLRLSPAGTLGTQVLQIDGDSDAWPVWRFTGAFTDVTLTLVSAIDSRATGPRSFTVTGPSGGIGSLVLTTDPRSRSLLTGSGNNAFDHLVRPADIWSLPPGVSEIEIEMTAGEEGASVKMEYRPRWTTS